MTNFINKNQTTQVKVRGDIVPHVLLNETALNKMYLYTKNAPGQDEIGWLGTAFYHEESNQYLIDDVFLFKQQVHGTTTEITPQGLEEFGMELLQQPNGVEIWNNLKMWGHSHVNMQINPSGQDDKQMEEFSKTGHDFFIRLICNKKGDLGIDIYDYKKGLEFHKCNWSVLEEEEPELNEKLEELQAKINAIQEELGKKKKERISEIEEPIKDEIKEKVAKLTYNYNYSYSRGVGTYVKNNTKINYQQQDDFYTEHEIRQMAKYIFTYQDFMDDVRADGATQFLTQAELGSVWAKILKYQKDENFWNEGAN